MATTLRWEKKFGESWFAYSGNLCIAHVVLRSDGTVGYTITAVYMKWVGKGYGDVKSVKTGKRAVQRGWNQWLQAAGLTGRGRNPTIIEMINDHRND